MAEIISKNGKKTNPRIDLTPMVDLGFLLITFFIFTTTLTTPNAMEIIMPVEEGEPTPIADHTAMTIFLGKNHQLYYYTGADAMNSNFENLKQTDLSSDGLRTALQHHIQQIKYAAQTGVKGASAKDNPFIIVKASNQSQYEDLVNLLDELTISNIQHYALIDINNNEEQVINDRG